MLTLHDPRLYYLRESYVREANEVLKLRDDQLDAVLRDLHAITADEELLHLSLKWRGGLFASENVFGGLPISAWEIPARAPLLPLIALFSGLGSLKQTYADRGIPEQVLHDTLSDVGRNMDWCKERNDRVAMEGYIFEWLSKHFTAKLYHLGRLHFEAFRFRENNAFLKKGDWVLNVHIPSGGKLLHDEILDSYGRGAELFRKLMPDIAWNGFICESWMLSPQLEELLGSSSNIVRFAADYQLYDVADDEGFYTYAFVKKLDDLRALPEITTLQRAMKAYLLAGGRILSGRGFFAIENI